MSQTSGFLNFLIYNPLFQILLLLLPASGISQPFAAMLFRVIALSILPAIVRAQATTTALAASGSGAASTSAVAAPAPTSVGVRRTSLLASTLVAELFFFFLQLPTCVL